MLPPSSVPSPFQPPLQEAAGDLWVTPLCTPSQLDYRTQNGEHPHLWMVSWAPPSSATRLCSRPRQKLYMLQVGHGVYNANVVVHTMQLESNLETSSKENHSASWLMSIFFPAHKVMFAYFMTYITFCSPSQAPITCPYSKRMESYLISTASCCSTTLHR